MSDPIVTKVPDVPDGALKLDLPPGIVRIVSDSMVESYTQSGYRLIATYVEQERTSRWVQSGNAGYNQSVEQIEYRPVRKFILWLHEGGSLIEMGQIHERDTTEIGRLKGELYTANDRLRGIAEKHKEELQQQIRKTEGCVRDIEARDRTIERLGESEKRAVENRNEIAKQLGKIADALRAVVKDEDVVAAMHAAITGGSPETTKDLLVNYFRLLGEIGATK